MKNVFSKTEPILVRCEKNYSFFFDFIEKELPGPNTAPLHRICSLMRKLKVKCFLKEELQHNREIKEEVAALSVRTDSKITATATRFTFFRKLPPQGNWRDLTNADVLGYAVLLRVDPPLHFTHTNSTPYQVHGYVLEAVIVPPSITLHNKKTESVGNYYVHCSREFETQVGTKNDSKLFQFIGTFFCQQNGYTNACAHAALRIAANSWPAYKGPKLTSERINKVLKIDHAKLKKERNRGLDTEEIASVIRSLGHEAQTAAFFLRPDINYEDYIYPLIESGCPVILGIARPGIDHVITILGHTLNSDRWAEARHGYGTMPKTMYISASAWADHFIFNDDNFGMYVTLPSEAVKNVIVPQYNPNLHATVAIGLFPEKPINGGLERVQGYIAEQVASIILRKLLQRPHPPTQNRWFALMKKGHTPVCRTILRDRATYLRSLSEMVDEKGHTLSAKAIKTVKRVLPSRVWVTEIMTPALYVGNKRKLGEIIIKTSATRADVQTKNILVFGWLGGFAWHGDFLGTGPIAWPITGHVPLARGIDLEKCKLEW